MIGVGFKILTRKITPSPPTIIEEMKGYMNSKNSVLIGQLSVKSST